MGINVKTIIIILVVFDVVLIIAIIWAIKYIKHLILLKKDWDYQLNHKPDLPSFSQSLNDIRVEHGYQENCGLKEWK